MRKLGTVLVAAGLTVAVAAPAHAVFVRPSTAPLLNAAGEDSGCDLTTSGSTFLRNDVRVLKHKGDVVCETEWARHRMRFSAFVVQDGQRALLYSDGGALGVGGDKISAASVTGSSTSSAWTSGGVCEKDAWGVPWDPQPGVTYQIILSTRATVKATADYTGEPWSARAEKLVKVTC